jgi:hypothetical protein
MKNERPSCTNLKFLLQGLPVSVMLRRFFASTSRLPRLDLKNLRVSEIEQNARDRVVDCNPGLVQHLYKQHLLKAQELEALLADRKKQTDVERGRLLKERIRVLTSELAAVDDELELEADKLPNSTSKHTPIGLEDQAKEIARNDRNKKEQGKKKKKKKKKNDNKKPSDSVSEALQERLIMWTFCVSTTGPTLQAQRVRVEKDLCI